METRATLERHVGECSQLRLAITAALDGLKSDHCKLRKLVWLVGSIVAGIEMLGGHAMIRIVLKKYGVELP